MTATTYRISLPNGETVTKNSTKDYSHAVVARSNGRPWKCVSLHTTEAHATKQADTYRSGAFYEGYQNRVVEVAR
jgi:hypothetical protein